ncbi:MAG TPA: Gfo/Idh/MocA family oxidoreductase [Armatimonadota bacterium]|nr:Gfo/Idh/MocA family oxidoreductase [Armatimonadota bacterium]
MAASSPPRLGVGIIGCNGVAWAHAKGHALVDETELKMVYDLDAQRASGMASTYECSVARSVDELLARQDIQIVDIVTPDETHVEFALQAVAAGKHVLVEKPVALALDDFDQIIHAVESAGVHAMGIQNKRWSPPNRKMVEMVKGGAVGQPVFIRIAEPASPFHTPDQKIWQQRDAAWMLVHNGCHQVDLLCWMLEAFPVRVHAVSHPGQDWLPVHEFISLMLTFPGGTVALSEENRIMQPAGYPFHREFYVVGTEGTLDLSDRQHHSTSMFTQDGFTPLGHEQYPDEENNFAGQFREFAQAILEERETPIPLSFTRQVVATVLAGAESMRNGQTVEMTEVGR